MQLKRRSQSHPQGLQVLNKARGLQRTHCYLENPGGTVHRVGCSLVCLGHRLPKKGLVTGWFVQLLDIKSYYDYMSALT